MSIRLRRIDGVGLVAICAARSVAKPGDVYLDDDAHHALARKFADDFASEGLIVPPIHAPDEVSAATEAEESNNPNRDWWDSQYASAAQKGEETG